MNANLLAAQLFYDVSFKLVIHAYQRRKQQRSVAQRALASMTSPQKKYKTSQGAATRPSNAAENLCTKVALLTERQAQTCSLRSRKKVPSKLARYGATRREKAKGGNCAHEAPKRSAKAPGG
eukprot:2707173-Pleurochrysis_carterae.AAC.1